MTMDVLTGPAPRPVSLPLPRKANGTAWLAVVAGFSGLAFLAVRGSLIDDSHIALGYANLLKPALFRGGKARPATATSPAASSDHRPGPPLILATSCRLCRTRRLQLHGG
jgi:hypothetical protein